MIEYSTNSTHASDVASHTAPTGVGSAQRPLLFVLYDLRHTFATRMVEAGIDLVALKESRYATYIQLRHIRIRRWRSTTD
jgi:hypothetical protein